MDLRTILPQLAELKRYLLAAAEKARMDALGYKVRMDAIEYTKVAAVARDNDDCPAQTQDYARIFSERQQRAKELSEAADKTEAIKMFVERLLM